VIGQAKFYYHINLYLPILGIKSVFIERLKMTFRALEGIINIIFDNA